MTSEKVIYSSVPLKDKHEESNQDSPHHKPPSGWGVRHTQTALLFISLTVGICIRAQLSVSVVAMTSNTSLLMWHPNISKNCLEDFSVIKEIVEVVNDTSGSIIEDTVDVLNKTSFNYRNISKVGLEDFSKIKEIVDVVNETSGSIVEEPVDVLNESVGSNVSDASSCEELNERWNIYRVYKWNKKIQEMILFSFFVGYTTMQIPMSILAQKFGGKLTVMTALATNGVLSVLTPWVPLFSGWLGVCICRFLQGMTQAAYYPSIHTMLAKWAPLSERGRLGAYIYTGSQFGTVVGFQVAGLFAGSPALGWPATFWFCGAFSLTCFALLAFFGAATPYDHPKISTEELVYIADGSDADKETKHRGVPWRHILRSGAVWGIVCTHAGSAVSYMFVFTQIPLYMNRILGVDIKKNGVYSSLPYVAMYFTSILMGYLGDWCINKHILSVVNVRRLGNTIGMGISSMFLVAFCYVNSTVAAVILLILFLSSHSGVHIGWSINMIDLSPNFAGSIMALSNMIGSLFTLTVPVFVSNILGDDVTNHYKWQVLFWIFGGAQFTSNLVYVAFAKGTPQPWNFLEEDNHQKDKHKNHQHKV